jgi:hypothetical protein
MGKYAGRPVQELGVGLRRATGIEHVLAGREPELSELALGVSPVGQEVGYRAGELTEGGCVTCCLAHEPSIARHQPDRQWQQRQCR